MRKALLLALFMTLSGGCVSYIDSSEELAELTAQAEYEVDVAKNMNYLWANTEELLQQSKQAADDAELANDAGDGDRAAELVEKAKSLANQALSQAKLAQDQADNNQNVEPIYPE